MKVPKSLFFLFSFFFFFICFLLPNVQCSVFVISPRGVVKRFETENSTHEFLDISIAPIGSIAFGELTIAVLFYFKERTTSLCDIFDKIQPLMPDISTAEGTPYLLIDLDHRCTFEHHIRLANELGFSGLMLITDEFSRYFYSELFKLDNDSTLRELDTIVMFISNKEAKLLISDEKIPEEYPMISISWDILPSNKVALDFAFDMADPHSENMLVKLTPFLKDIESVTDMRFWYKTSLETSNLNNATRNFCYAHEFKNVTNLNGNTIKVCVTPSEYVLFATGASLAEEIIRRYCIQQKYPKKFLSYQNSHTSDCDISEHGKTGFGNECSNVVLQKVNINQDVIDECLNSESIFPMVERGYSTIQVTGNTPFLRINEVHKVPGRLDANSMKRAICLAFLKTPAGCLPHESSTAISVSLIIIVVFLVIAFLIFSSIIYHKYIKQSLQKSLKADVATHVQKHVNEYIQLPDRELNATRFESRA